MNYITNLEKRITSDLKLLKDEEIIVRLPIGTLNKLDLDQVLATG